MRSASRVSIQSVPRISRIPLSVQGIANIKIAGDEPLLGNALERFLGIALAEVQDIAKDTLEGNLRGVLATLTPEEVNEDRLKFAQSLIGEADVDLASVIAEKTDGQVPTQEG